MNDNAQQSNQVDVTAVSQQIQILKNQRSAAMDDVAVLMGQLTSLKEQYEALQKKYKELEPDAKNSDHTTAGN